jgi:hypothetical protein
MAGKGVIDADRHPSGGEVMQPRDTSTNRLVIDYLFLRKTVGWIGALLPIVLITGNALLFSTDLPDSMSGYYYTHMRDVFVGALCALGVFLFAYAGYDDWDRWITNIAGAGTIGVAFCPTKPTVCSARQHVCLPPAVRSLTLEQQVVGDVHLAFAVIAFLALGVMAIRFTKLPPTGEKRPAGFMNWIRTAFGFPLPGQPDPRTPGERHQDAIYRSCGIVIIVCVILGAASNVLPSSVSNAVPVLFILEALAVFAFGISWFVKGRTLVPTAQRLATYMHPGNRGVPSAA